MFSCITFSASIKNKRWATPIFNAPKIKLLLYVIKGQSCKQHQRFPYKFIIFINIMAL